MATEMMGVSGNTYNSSNPQKTTHFIAYLDYTSLRPSKLQHIKAYHSKINAIILTSEQIHIDAKRG